MLPSDGRATISYSFSIACFLSIFSLASRSGIVLPHNVFLRAHSSPLLWAIQYQNPAADVIKDFIMHAFFLSSFRSHYVVDGITMFNFFRGYSSSDERKKIQSSWVPDVSR